MAYDWSTFTKRISVRATEEEIYRAWTTEKGLVSWFLRTSIFTGPSGTRTEDDPCQEGDTFLWQWFGYCDDVQESRKILSNNGKNAFSFEFSGGCVVAVEISSYEGGSIVELVQSNIPTDESGKTGYHLGCMEGWTFYLANLKSVLEGGLDLRNKDEKLQGLINS